MKAATVVGVLVGVLALILAIVALTTAPEGADEMKPQIAKLRGEMADVSSSLGELNSRLDKMGERISSVARDVAKARAPAEVDEDRVRQIMRDEMRALSDRFRRGARGRGDRDTSVEALRDRVGLDQEKAQRVAQIRNRMREASRDIWRENRGGSREKNHELMQGLQKKGEEEIAKLLTDEEMKKYRELMSRGDRGRHGGREGHGRGRRDGDEGHPAGDEGGGDNAF